MLRTSTSAPKTTTHLLRDLTMRQHVSLSGRAAAGIWAALRAWGFTDRVILLPANTCYIVLWAVLKSGNRPLLVDVDPLTGYIDITKLPVTSRQLPDSNQVPNKNSVLPSERPAAIIPCHMYGLVAPMQAICKWAQVNDVKVLEDAALALGGEVDGQPTGSWGDAAVFSFGLGKLVDNQVGGALVTDDAALSGKVERLLMETPVWDDHLMALTNQWHGLYWSLHQYEMDNPRLLSLYPELYSIYSDITVYQLEDNQWDDLPGLLRGLPDNLAHRNHVAIIYDDMHLETLVRPDGTVLWKYPLIVSPDVRDDLLGHLWEQGIHDATRWYPPLRHMMSALAPDVVQPPTPGADRLGASIINLPLGPDVDEAYVRQVAKLIIDYL